MNEATYKQGVECCREVLVNRLGETYLDNTDVKGKLAYWLLHQATDKQILTMVIEGWIPFDDSNISDYIQQDFEDIMIINETMTCNKVWDYARIKQFVYDNCSLNPARFKRVTMENFEKYQDVIDINEKEGLEVEEVIANMAREGLVEITEPESVTHGELPIKIRTTTKKIAACIASVGFILIVAGLFFNSKKE